MPSLTFWATFIFLVVSSSLAAAGGLNPLLEASSRYERVRVLRVFSADRIMVENDEKVSLAGIKGPAAPRLKDVQRDERGFVIPDEDPTTPFGLEAAGFVRSLAEGRQVRLEFNTLRRADNGDMLAYVILPDGKLLNAEVLRNGYADLRIVPPNMKHAEELRAAYREARREMRGIHNQ